MLLIKLKEPQEKGLDFLRKVARNLLLTRKAKGTTSEIKSYYWSWPRPLTSCIGLYHRLLSMPSTNGYRLYIWQHQYIWLKLTLLATCYYQGMWPRVSHPYHQPIPELLTEYMILLTTTGALENVVFYIRSHSLRSHHSHQCSTVPT